MTKRLEQLRSGQEFVRYAEQRGAELRNGKGSHCIVSTKRGSAVVPRHSSDLGKGLRSKIIKQFMAMGIAGIILAYVAILLH